MNKKNIIISAIVVVFVLALAFVFLYVNPFDFKIGFDKKQLEIERTANLVTEIKKISEFTTACFYEELVIKDVKYKYKERKIYQKSDNWYKRQLGLGKKEIGTQIDSTEIGSLVLIAKGKIRAGLNFSKLTQEDFRIQNDTLYATLPEAEIFDIIVNPSDIEIFHRDGDYWNETNVSELVSKGKMTMRDDAMLENILEKANKYGLEKMSNIFKTFGFKEAIVTLKKTDTANQPVEIKVDNENK